MLYKNLTALVIAVLLSWQAEGQSLVLSAYKTKCDTLSTLVKERTSVSANIKLQSVSRRSGTLDFHFSSGIGDVPWTKSDLEWLKKTLHDIAPAGYAHYKIGTIYCGQTPLGGMLTTAPGNDGRPAEHQWKVRDPLSSAAPAMVRQENGQNFRKGLSGRYIALW